MKQESCHPSIATATRRTQGRLPRVSGGIGIPFQLQHQLNDVGGAILSCSVDQALAVRMGAFSIHIEPRPAPRHPAAQGVGYEARRDIVPLTHSYQSHVGLLCINFARGGRWV